MAKKSTSRQRDEKQSIDIAVIMEKTEKMERDIQEIKRDLKSLPKRLRNEYVSQDQFLPVKNITYGMVGFILIAFIGAIINMVIN